MVLHVAHLSDSGLKGSTCATSCSAVSSAYSAAGLANLNLHSQCYGGSTAAILAAQARAPTTGAVNLVTLEFTVCLLGRWSTASYAARDY